MSIFNFWKKNKQLESIKVEETKQDNIEESLSLAGILVTLMQTYIEENVTTAYSIPTLDSNIRTNYEELVSLGLGNTVNAKLLKKDIDSYNYTEKQKEKALKLIYFVKEVARVFGTTSILISNTQFIELCNKYKLSIGLLEDYNGVIPIENIKELKEVKNKLNIFPYSNILNKKEDYYTLFKVNKANIDSTNESFIKKFLKDHNNIVPILAPSRGETSIYPKSRVPGLESIAYEYFNRFEGKIIRNSDLFIACPKKYLDNKEIKVSVRPVDPIVFHYCPYGVLIHTTWGEESEDVILKKYMEICKNIKDM